MAKFCEVCKRSYPDDEQYCPHCTAAVGESGINLGAPPGQESSSISGVSAVESPEVVAEPAAAPAAQSSEDSAIDLGPPQSSTGGQPGSGSGSSIELISPAPEPQTGSQMPAMDSSSDYDVQIPPEGGEATAPAVSGPGVPRAAEPGAPALASDQEMVRDLLGGKEAGAESAVPDEGLVPAESASAVDLGASPSSQADAASVHLGRAVEEVVMAEMAGEAARVEPASASGLDLSEAVVVEDVTGTPLPGEAVSVGDAGAVLDKNLALEEPVMPHPQ